ncbi:bactofilin family protein [Magnetospirillum moscoviense]|nr:polymer-forming cytoskeletal protein [Magnetospirillum moscoviense]
MFRKLAKVNPMGGGHAKSAVPLSVIGPDVRIVGDIFTQGEMQIDGQVEGDIACQNLVVGEGARISGEVTAETVHVHGELRGKITATTISIAHSAKVIGDITHCSLEIEAGAEVEGHFARKNAGAPAEAAAEAPKKSNGAALPAPAAPVAQAAVIEATTDETAPATIN